MNLFEILKKIPESQNFVGPIPSYLYGAFRRKSISFFNGLTDENTIVYWFQSRSFTIDLRLKHRSETPVNERQGWIGHTLWDTEQALLSWQVSDTANYQNHVQWPEPAKLHAIGNCILEFSPSNVYVEDWRQQVHSGLYLGLRLKTAVDVESGEQLNMDGGLIICDQHVAYTLTRLPKIQNIVSHLDLTADGLESNNIEHIESFEVSIGTDGHTKYYSTSSEQTDQPFNFDDFEIIDDSTLQQRTSLNGRQIDLIFDIDIYQSNYLFQQQTLTTPDSEHWLKSEESHLLHHAKLTL
ncbi:hypothetical protein HLH17_11485 [Acinetobacter sp. ANC 5380]|uniref:Uncharacterized protein n=1 Tax=Acinetobacter terrae TaxID=2731247 RepID=A0A7Y2RGF0_9GAMM|nr:hypothetical protein [Acinetobacter terrae]NNH78280.1 hypothetical protein [Acinetobacter terrae]